MRAARWWILLAVCLTAGLLSLSPLGAHPDEDGSRHKPQEPADGPAVLAQPVKLEFVVDEGEGVGFTVLCASDEYRTSIDHSGENGENHIEVEGEVHALADDGTVLLNFNATIFHADLASGEEITFSARGSSVLKPGDKRILATSPGPGLSVTMHPAGE